MACYCEAAAELPAYQTQIAADCVAKSQQHQQMKQLLQDQKTNERDFQQSDLTAFSTVCEWTRVSLQNRQDRFSIGTLFYIGVIVCEHTIDRSDAVTTQYRYENKKVLAVHTGVSVLQSFILYCMRRYSSQLQLSQCLCA